MKISSEWPHGYGQCHCGCGQKTSVAPKNDAKYGWTKGEPQRYVSGHDSRTISWASLPNIFWDRVDRSDPDGCWSYTGTIGNAGYGVISVTGMPIRAHRLAYILTYGEIPDDLLVRHLCNNRICCNHAHLALGTNQDNSDDKMRAGRQTRGEDDGNAVLTEVQVLDIYARCVCGEAQRTIAKDYSVTQAAVSKIFTGKSWAWLTGAKEMNHDE